MGHKISKNIGAFPGKKRYWYAGADLTTTEQCVNYLSDPRHEVILQEVLERINSDVANVAIFAAATKAFEPKLKRGSTG